MRNSEKPAYPAVNESSNDAQSFYEPGLTKREIFAKDAPEVMPDWFYESFKSTLMEPVEPKVWDELKVEEAHRESLQNWHYDPCYDLPEELHWYQEAWEKYLEDKAEYIKQKKSEMYFAWRLYFADQLLTQLEL